MPSLFSYFLKLQLRIVRPILRRITLMTTRRYQDRIGLLGARVHASHLVFAEMDFPHFSACWVFPKADMDAENYILYLHGGAYTAGNIEYAVGFGSVLAVESRRRVLCAAYRLAPEHPFPAAVEDALFAYKRMLALGIDADKIALCGESAGGGLIYALALKIKQEGLPMPQCLVGISPWVDLTLSGESYQRNRRRDPSLHKQSLLESVRMYANHGKDAENELVSPIFGDLSGMPPSLLFVGGDELLLDDAYALAARLKACECECELIVERGMWHAYVLYATREGRRARTRMAEFFDEQED